MSSAYGNKTDLGNGVVLEIVNTALDADLVIYQHLYTTTGPGQPKELKRIRLTRAVVDSLLTPALDPAIGFGLKTNVGGGLVLERTSADGDIQLSIYRDLYTTTGVGEPVLLREVTISDTLAATLSSAVAPPKFGGHATLGDVAAYWDMNESSGNRIDKVASVAVSPIGTVTSGAGIEGSAAQFGGGVDAGLETAGAFLDVALPLGMTINFWFKWAGSDSTGGCWTSKGDGYNNPTWDCFYTSAGGGTQFTPQVNFYTAAGGADSSSAALAVQSSTNWVMITAWYDPSDKKARICINNGTAAAGSASVSGNLYQSSNELGIGSEPGAGARDFQVKGKIDAFGIWKRVLTSQERSDLYASGAGLFY